MKNLLKIVAISVAVISIYAFNKSETEKIKIVIDAAHGGHDTGAKHNLTSEKEIVSQISSKINQLNKNANVELFFTRTNDEFMSLETRTNIINNINPDFLLSLHVNSNKNPEASGAEIFIPKKEDFRDQSLVLAEKLAANLQTINIKCRGIKQAPFMLLTKTTCPAILLELGFISNNSDRAFLTENKNQELIAQSILNFIEKSK